MLQHKGIEHEWVKVAPGAQAFRVRLAGFRGGTVPALRLDGRRVVGSRRISRLLDEVKPEPPLFPADPGRRRAVEAAEEWGETVLQPIPRRLLRWAIRHHPDARVMLARVLGSPRPELVARASSVPSPPSTRVARTRASLSVSARTGRRCRDTSTTSNS
jgi:glutathione S-transferase